MTKFGLRYMDNPAHDLVMRTLTMFGPIWKKSHTVKNFVVPGLNSIFLEDLLGGGRLRLFEMTRAPEMEEVPHTHRYNIKCLVLTGSIVYRSYNTDICPRDMASHAALRYNPKNHSVNVNEPTFMTASIRDFTYNPGHWVNCNAQNFHSMRFNAGATALFMEGEKKELLNHCLVPCDKGKILNTFHWKDWMMDKGLLEKAQA